MAKPVPDPTDAVVEDEDDSPASQGGGVQVDLKETPKEAPKEPGKEAPAAAPVDDRRWKALESQVAATRRVNEDLKRQVQTLNERLQQPPSVESGATVLPKGTTQETIDKYDQLVTDGKWQEAVRVLSREEYKAARAVESVQEQIRAVEDRRLSTLERSKLLVESLYPTLHREKGDRDAVESQLFDQAVSDLSQSDEQFLHDPYAPELAMHRMEQLAREQGIKLTKADAQPAGTATGRPLGRAGQTSMPASRGSGGATTYTLTRDQKEWCDANLGHLAEGERYKHYARFAKMAETGGVEA